MWVQGAANPLSPPEAARAGVLASSLIPGGSCMAMNPYPALQGPGDAASLVPGTDLSWALPQSSQGDVCRGASA